MSPPKRIGTVYGGILRRPPRHRRPWSYEKRLALKSMVASRLASLIFTALAAFFIGKGDQPEAVIYTALAAVWFWIAQLKLAQYKEEKK